MWVLLLVAGGEALALSGLGGQMTPIGTRVPRFAQTVVATAGLAVRTGVDVDPGAGRVVGRHRLD